jgi:hypothetical protein
VQPFTTINNGNINIVPDGTGVVGIGTTTPLSSLELDIVGSNRTPLTTTPGNVNIRTSEAQGIGVGGSLSFGGFNDDAASAFRVFGSLEGKKETSGSGISDGYLAFKTNNSGSFAERLRITSDGNVGIGTTTPTNALSVVGNMQATGLVSCDTIDTDANGVLSCGTDATGGGDGLATSTPIADTEIIYGTSPSQVGSEAAFTYDDATNLLTVTNASTTLLSATTLFGALTGNADTSTALAANGGNCSAGSYPLGIDASGAVETCTDASTEIDSIVATHAGVAAAHQALVTLAGTPNYLSLSGQEITLAKLDITDDTNLIAGTNITLSTNTLNVDDAFLINDGDDTTTGQLTATNFVGSDATATTTFAGSVGIGTTTPNEIFHIASDSIANLKVQTTGSFNTGIKLINPDQEWRLQNLSATDNFRIRDHTNTKDIITIEPNSLANSIYIDASGNLGISDTTPASLLTVGANDAFQVSSLGVVASGTWNGNAVDISDYTNLAGTANEITLTDDTLSIHADIARDSELHDAVTLAGTGTYLSLAGQAITVDPITESDISDLSHTADTNLTTEEVEDLAGALVASSSGTHTDITVTYQDATSDIDFVIDTLPNLTGTLDVNSGGTGATSLTDGGILLGSGTGAITALGAATNGQIPIGDGTTDPVLATITGGTNASVTNGAGSITINVDDSFLINDGSDTMTGTLTADGLTLGANENITLGSNTLDHDGTAFVFNDSVAVTGLFISTVGLDGVGAIDLDYGSADITDHTFITDSTGDAEIVLPNDSIGDAEIDWSGLTASHDFSVPDEAYGAGWNGSTEVPTKNAVFDKIEEVEHGYEISTVSGVLSPADATTYYFGGIPLAPNTNEAIARKVIPTAGTITKISILTSSVGVAGTNESSTLSFRLNNTTDTTVSAAVKTDSSTTQIFSNTGLSITVAEGDFFTMKWLTPTWVTNPTNTFVRATIWVDTN